jgi:hypothetical protein
VGVVLAPAFLFGVAAFARAIGFGFVYDDHWTVEGTPIAMPFWRLVRLLASGHARGIADATRPSMVLSVWLDRALFGANPAGYHVDSLLLYGVVSALAAWTALAITGRHRMALVCGLAFALAPLHAEVACAINYREDLLAAIGVLVALLGLVRPNPISRWIVCACFAMGLLAKESAVALVPIALAFAIDPSLRARMLSRRRLLATLAAVLGFWMLWRFAIAHDDIPRARYAIDARIFGTARFLVRTGAMSLVPLWPSPDYARQAPASPVWLAALAGWIGTVWLLGRRPGTRVLAMGLAIALVAPLPSSPLAAPVNETADRYAFLGVLGGALVLAWVAYRVPARMRAPAIGLAAAGLMLACWHAAAPWKSDRTLWLEATKQAPTSPRAWLGLSQAARVEGDLDEADRDIDRALALDPKFIGAHVTRTYNLLARGNVEGARAELEAIHALGGDDRAGVARAARCAALPPDDAIACIR